MERYDQFVNGFFTLVAEGEVEIYNEFSLQHELGIYLRQHSPSDFKVQFERPIDFFGFTPREYVKREIDIVIFSAGRRDPVAIETKFPRNGRYPESMFDAWKDVQFLEQLVHGGFISGLFVMVADDPLFFQGEKQDGVYGPFRGGAALHGLIQKPTGKRDESVQVEGSYRISWKNVVDSIRYCVVAVGPE